MQDFHYFFRRINHQNLVQFHGIVIKGRPIEMVTELMPYG